MVKRIPLFIEPNQQDQCILTWYTQQWWDLGKISSKGYIFENEEMIVAVHFSFKMIGPPASYDFWKALRYKKVRII